MQLYITEQEKDIVGRLFGCYLNLLTDYNGTVAQKLTYPQFSNFTERVIKIKSHIQNLEDLASDLGYQLCNDKTPKNIPEIVTAYLVYDKRVYITFDFKAHRLTVDKALI